MKRWGAAELSDPAPLAAGTCSFSAIAHVTAAGLGTRRGRAF